MPASWRSQNTLPKGFIACRPVGRSLIFSTLARPMGHPARRGEGARRSIALLFRAGALADRAIARGADPRPCAGPSRPAGVFAGCTCVRR